jgi:hypothetical protein
MMFYVDESGVFANPRSQPNAISTVAVLGVPTSSGQHLEQTFLALKSSWKTSPGSSEVKGSSLREDQVIATLNLLNAAGCHLWVGLIDTGLFPAEETYRAKRIQARMLKGDIEAFVHLSMRAEVIRMAKLVLRMSTPMFAQTMCSLRLLDISFRESLIHLGLYDPQELGHLEWVFDAKGSQLFEDPSFVEVLVCGYLQSTSLEDRVTLVRQGDYSAFAHHFQEEPSPPTYLAPHVRSGASPFQSIDLGAVVRKHIQFSNSNATIGLQLADICANAVARAVKGNLRRDAWERLGPLLFRRPEGAVLVLEVSPTESSRRPATANMMPYAGVLTRLDQLASAVIRPDK